MTYILYSYSVYEWGTKTDMKTFHSTALNKWMAYSWSESKWSMTFEKCWMNMCKWTTIAFCIWLRIFIGSILLQVYHYRGFPCFFVSRRKKIIMVLMYRCNRIVLIVPICHFQAWMQSPANGNKSTLFSVSDMRRYEFDE